MPKFFYRARSKKGELTDGAIVADDLWLARKALVKLNLEVLELGRYNWAAFVDLLKQAREHFKKTISLEEKMVFVGQLETGYTVGIPITQVLELMQEEVTNLGLRAVISVILKDVRSGSSLHHAFAKHPRYFDDAFVNIIRIGEMTGGLEQVLARSVKLIQQQSENRGKIKSATFYPKIVIGFMVIVIGVVVYFVIPRVKAFLKVLGKDLPPITQAVVSVSDFFVGYWYIILTLGLAGYIGSKIFLSTPNGRLWADRMKLKLPILGTIFAQLELNQFCVILDLLIGSGIPLAEGLTILAAAQNNRVYTNQVLHCRREIEKGSSLHKGMSDSPLFPLSFKNLISIGEESGRLPIVLQRLGKYYQTQLDYRLENLTRLIEPVLLAFIFVMVLILALAVYLPIWQMSQPRQ